MTPRKQFKLVLLIFVGLNLLGACAPNNEPLDLPLEQSVSTSEVAYKKIDVPLAESKTFAQAQELSDLNDAPMSLETNGISRSGSGGGSSMAQGSQGRQENAETGNEDGDIGHLVLIKELVNIQSLFFQNGGFELEDLSGWAANIPPGGSIDVLNFDPASGNSAVEGNLFARLKTNGPGSFTTLSRSFNAVAGQTVSGYAFFHDAEFGGCVFNDQMSVRILAADTSVVATVFMADSCTTGTRPWTAWGYTFTGAEAPGPYTLEARIANGGDEIVDSIGGIDGAAGCLDHQVEPFSISVDGSTIAFDDGESVSPESTVFKSKAIRLREGKHTLSELDLPNFSEGDWQCDNWATGLFDNTEIAITSGETLVCTIVNTQYCSDPMPSDP